MKVDIGEISGQMAELFCVNPVEMLMEVINLQNNVHGIWGTLKSQRTIRTFNVETSYMNKCVYY